MNLEYKCFIYNGYNQKQGIILRFYEDYDNKCQIFFLLIIKVVFSVTYVIKHKSLTLVFLGYSDVTQAFLLLGLENTHILRSLPDEIFFTVLKTLLANMYIKYIDSSGSAFQKF